MQETFFWHGTGILCLIIGVQCLYRIATILHKKNTAIILKTTGIGIAAGILGVICGWLMLLGVEDLWNLEPIPGTHSAARLIVGAVFVYFGAFLTGITAGAVLRKTCHSGAIVYIAFGVVTLFAIRPVVYGWVQSVFSTV